MHSGLAGGCFRKKMKFELALLWDSLDPYGSRKNEKKAPLRLFGPFLRRLKIALF